MAVVAVTATAVAGAVAVIVVVAVVMTKFVAQEDGSWCFVCALVNCAIYLEREPLDLAEAKRVARCEHGPAVARHEAVVWSLLPLFSTDKPLLVLRHGGIISIQHPIYNGHSFFVFPDGKESVSLVNSWLGPLVAKGIGYPELLPFIASNFGDHWVLDRGLERD